VPETAGMKKMEKDDARVRAIAAALSLNRGEIDPAKLVELLRVIEKPLKPATS
jgi:hypothetical protein